MQQRLQSSNGEPTPHWDVGFTSQVGRTHRNSALNARMEPYQTDPTEALFHGDANQRKTEAIEWMGWVCDLNRVSRECG